MIILSYVKLVVYYFETSPIVILASEREYRDREIVTGFKIIGSKRDKRKTRSIISKAILSH